MPLDSLLPASPGDDLRFKRQQEVVKQCHGRLAQDRKPMVTSIVGRSGVGKTVAGRKAMQQWVDEARELRQPHELAPSSSAKPLNALLHDVFERDQLCDVALDLHRTSRHVVLLVNDAERLVANREALREWNKQLTDLEPLNQLRRDVEWLPRLRLIFTSQVPLGQHVKSAIHEIEYEDAQRADVARSVTPDDVYELAGRMRPSLSGLRLLLEDAHVCGLLCDPLIVALLNHLCRDHRDETFSAVNEAVENCLRDLLPRGDARVGDIKNWGHPLRTALGQGHSEARIHATRNRLRRQLYRAVIEGGEDARFHRALLCHLLAIAAVDPHFDELAEVESGQWGTLGRSIFGDRVPTVTYGFRFLFHDAPQDRRTAPRVTHRSVLDLYRPEPDEWPYDPVDREFSRAGAHAAVARWLNGHWGATPTPRRRLVKLRHELRAGMIPDVHQYLEQVEEVSHVLSLRTISSHDLAWSYADAVACSPASRQHVLRVADENAAGSWYQPPVRPPQLALPEASGRFMGVLAIFGELAYNALDAWSATEALANDARDRAGAVDKTGDASQVEAATFLACLDAACAYESGHAEQARATLISLDKRGLPSRYGWHVDATLMVARLKADVAEIDPADLLSHQAWLEALTETKALQRDLERSIAWGLGDARLVRSLDSLRVSINAGRLVHYQHGYWAAIEHYEALIAEVRGSPDIDRERGRDIMGSQEFLFACIGYAHALLCGGKVGEARNVLEEDAAAACAKTGDTWALAQVRFLRAWVALLDGEGGAYASPQKAFDACARTFAQIGDRKAEHCARYAAAAACGEHYQPEPPKGEAFYAAVHAYQMRCKNGATEVPDVIERWFASSLHTVAHRGPRLLPIMPGALILRGVPLSFPERRPSAVPAPPAV